MFKGVSEGPSSSPHDAKSRQHDRFVAVPACHINNAGTRRKHVLASRDVFPGEMSNTLYRAGQDANLYMCTYVHFGGKFGKK